jgi:hypothetical protein
LPLNEANPRSRRARYPLAFDLEGVPRDNAERDRLLLAEREQLTEEQNPVNVPLVKNTFTVDQPQQPETVVDINNPPHRNYNPRDPKNEFPKMLYPPTEGKPVVVQSKEQEAEFLKKKFTHKPLVKKTEEESD